MGLQDKASKTCTKSTLAHLETDDEEVVWVNAYPSTINEKVGQVLKLFTSATTQF